MALMAIVAALSDLPARDFEGLLQMFLSILQALSDFPDLIVALGQVKQPLKSPPPSPRLYNCKPLIFQVNAVVCACRAVGPSGACL